MITALALLAFLGDPPPPAIGAQVGAFTFTDTRWLSRSLDDLGARKAYVIVFTTVDCPLARRALPRLAEIEKRWRARDVGFLGVDVGDGDALVEVAANAVEAGVEFPFARDFDGAVRRALGPTRSPEVCVLDPQRVLRYRGRVGSEERLGGPSPAPSAASDLENALEDLVAGRAVARDQTPVEGCKLNPTGPAAENSWHPDFDELVAPILAEHCNTCHGYGGSGPFELTSEREARRRAAMIAEVVEQGRMPPWHASDRYGEFENDRRLSDAERRVLVTWAGDAVASGRIDGPAVRGVERLPPGWRIGTPDLVLKSETIDLPASGTVPYRYVVLPHVFTRDTWIEAIEIRPTNPRVLHHANLAFYTVGGDIREANFITGQVPGGEPMDLGPGTAALVPAGSLLGLQVHHVPVGVPAQDVIEVGLRFPRAVVERRMRHFEVADLNFAIPPLEPAYPVRAQRTFDVDAIGIGMFVHMHLRGRDMRFDARHPDGRVEPLLLVPNYDFNWQSAYRWKAGAQAFEKGTVVECLAHFDNSRFNPWNPAPEKRVTFGLETTDEMMYGFLFYVARDEHLGLSIDAATGAVAERPAR